MRGGGTLLGVLAQRLVRTLCKNCKVRDEETTREMLAEVIKPWQINGGYKPYKRSLSQGAILRLVRLNGLSVCRRTITLKTGQRKAI